MRVVLVAVVLLLLGATAGRLHASEEQPALAVVAIDPVQASTIRLVAPDARVSTLTSHPALPLDGAWSPDGSRIAFSAGGRRGVGEVATGPVGIYTMRADGTDVRLAFTTKSTTSLLRPRWSPDGRLIAFGVGVTLWVADARTGAHRTRVAQLVETTAGPIAWSHDGRRIAFEVCRDDACALYAGSVGGGGRLQRLSRKMTGDAVDFGGITDAEWSHDDRSVAIVMSDGEHLPQVVVVAADGTGERAIARGSFPVWSRDDRTLAFVATRTLDANGSAVPAGIAVVPARGGRTRLLADVAGAEVEPTWARDGTLIAFAAGQRLYVADTRAGHLARLPAALRVETRADGAWSPNGIVLLSRLDEKVEQERVVLLGVATRRIIRGATDSLPTWSGDGARLAFVRRSEVWTISPAGSNLREVGGGTEPSWAPNGRQMALADHGRIVIVDLAKGEGRTVGRGERPAWAPDGKFLAWVTRQGLALLPLSGENQLPRIVSKPVSDPDGRGFVAAQTVSDPAWSPDSHLLAFSYTTYDFNAEPRVAVIDIAADTQDELGDLHHPVWSPDGTSIAARTLDGLAVYDIATRTLKVVARYGERWSWSPDGTTLAYVDDGVAYTVRPDGDGRRRLPIPGAIDLAYRPRSR